MLADVDGDDALNEREWIAAMVCGRLCKKVFDDTETTLVPC
jgi:hypothetical protein